LLASFNGSLNIGNILPPGLTQAELEDTYFSRASISFPFNPNGTGGGGSDMEIIVFPEPASLSILAIGGFVLTRRRNRPLACVGSNNTAGNPETIF
jgi:hypothetical protein